MIMCKTENSFRDDWNWNIAPMHEFTKITSHTLSFATLFLNFGWEVSQITGCCWSSSINWLISSLVIMLNLNVFAITTVKRLKDSVQSNSKGSWAANRKRGFGEFDGDLMLMWSWCDGDWSLMGSVIVPLVVLGTKIYKL